MTHPSGRQHPPSGVDLPRARSILAEALQMHDAGTMTRDEFVRLWHELEVAVGPHGREMMEGLVHFAADLSWVPDVKAKAQDIAR